MRITKKEREKNAINFYNNLMNGYSKNSAIYIKRESSKTNPYVNRVQLYGVVAFNPVIIAESTTEGVRGALLEFVSFVNVNSLKSDKNVYNYMYIDKEKTNTFLRHYLSTRISYDDGMVIMLERD